MRNFMSEATADQLVKVQQLRVTVGCTKDLVHCYLALKEIALTTVKGKCINKRQEYRRCTL